MKIQEETQSLYIDEQLFFLQKTVELIIWSHNNRHSRILEEYGH